MILRYKKKESEKALIIFFLDGGEYKCEILEKIMYLGVEIDESGHELNKLKARVTKGNKKLGSLRA